ncbi:MAG: hypothetical protein IKW51_10770 [Bacteroidales bacterium]|nr:hypothetical protein [Bacteroidales bacterium]
MKRKLLLLLPVAMLFLSMTSCDEEIDRVFHPVISICNYDIGIYDSLFVEYNDIYTDSTYTKVLVHDEYYNIWLPFYHGYITQKFPPEEHLTAALENITIYRYKDNTIQYLPKEEYDEAEEDFMLGKDVFFDEHTVFYTLLVTESMFEE